MRRLGWVAGLALGVGACAPTLQERAREYNLDGVYLYQKGSYVGARDSFRAALSLQPGNPDLLFNLGQCYDHLHDDVRAEQSYNQCLGISPNHAECRHALAVLLRRTGRGADATRMIEDWLRKEPKLAAAYAEDGWLRAENGDPVSAQKRFLQALGIDPHDNRALTELARYYETTHRPDRALVLYQRALQYNPQQPALVERVSYLRSQGVGLPHPD